MALNKRYVVMTPSEIYKMWADLGGKGKEVEVITVHWNGKRFDLYRGRPWPSPMSELILGTDSGIVKIPMSNVQAVREYISNQPEPLDLQWLN